MRSSVIFSMYEPLFLIVFEHLEKKYGGGRDSKHNENEIQYVKNINTKVERITKV